MEPVKWDSAIWSQTADSLGGGDCSHFGICRFDPTTGPYLDIPFGDFSAEPAFSKTGVFAQGVEGNRYDRLYGFTQKGRFLTLSNVRSNGVGWASPGSSYESFCADFLYESVGDYYRDDEISSVDLGLGGLKRWLGVRPPYKVDSNEYRVKMGAIKSEDLYSSDMADVEIRYVGSRVRFVDEGLCFDYRAYVHFELRQPCTFEECWSQEISRLYDAFAFLFGGYPPIDWVSCVTRERNVKANVYFAVAPASERTSLGNNPAILFSGISHKKGNSFFEQWMDMNGDERYATSLLSSLLRPPAGSPTKLVFDATAMLEAVGRLDEEGLYTKEELSRLIDPMIRVADDEIKDRVRGLFGMLSRRSYRMVLAGIYDICGKWGRELIEDWNRFSKEQYLMRNQGAHGLKPGEQIDVSMNHYYAQILLAYLVLMIRMGFEDDVLDNFMNSGFLSSAKWRIKQAYKNGAS